MTDTTLHFVATLALPVVAFLLLALVPPLRRRGRLAGIVSLCFSMLGLATTWVGWLHAGLNYEPIRLLVSWLPSYRGPLASVGVLIDPASTTMLLLVALVSCLVQAYSLGYLHDEPGPSLGRY